MAKRKIDPERQVLIKQLLATYGAKDVGGIQAMIKDLFTDALQNALEGELEEELGYSKHDYANKSTSNSRNGYSKKTIESSMGDF